MLRTTHRQRHINTHTHTHTPVHGAELDVVVLINLHQQPVVDVTVESSNRKLRIKVKVFYFPRILGQRRDEEEERDKTNQILLSSTESAN